MACVWQLHACAAFASCLSNVSRRCGLVVVNTNDLFEFSTVMQTRGHRYKLFKKSNNQNIRTTFFCEHVINTWNKLPADTDFSSLSKFKRIITSMDFSSLFLVYTSVTPIATPMVLLYRFYCIFVYHVLIILDLLYILLLGQL